VGGTLVGRRAGDGRDDKVCMGSEVPAWGQRYHPAKAANVGCQCQLYEANYAVLFLFLFRLHIPFAYGMSLLDSQCRPGRWSGGVLEFMASRAGSSLGFSLPGTETKMLSEPGHKVRDN